MNHKILNFKDLIGGNWSPEAIINKEKGNLPYIKVEGGLLLEVGPKKSTKNAIYLSPEQAKRYNEITIQINELQEERKKIIE